MVRIRKILLVVVSALVGIFFILPLIGVGILKWAVLPPEKLTPLVVEKTNEFIEAHLECERVDLFRDVSLSGSEVDKWAFDLTSG